MGPWLSLSNSLRFFHKHRVNTLSIQCNLRQVGQKPKMNSLCPRLTHFSPTMFSFLHAPTIVPCLYTLVTGQSLGWVTRPQGSVLYQYKWLDNWGLIHWNVKCFPTQVVVRTFLFPAWFRAMCFPVQPVQGCNDDSNLIQLKIAIPKMTSLLHNAIHY